MSKYILTPSEVFLEATKEVDANGIPAGTYIVNYDGNSGTATIEPFKVNSDSLVDIPNSIYSSMVDEINVFFKKETKEKFDRYGFLYKKSILLHGAPGTGKTCLVVKIIDVFSKQFEKGIVVFNPHLRGLALLSKHVPEDVPIVCIFEEFDGVFDLYSEAYILSLLDGEIQRPNTVYLFTTNYIDKIPNRLFRPGRISNVVEVTNPNLEARIHYLKSKMPDLDLNDIQQWAHKTDGLSLDDLKYTVLAVQCLGVSLEDSVKNLLEGQKLLAESENEYDDQDNALRSIAQFIKGAGNPNV